jgi:invasion protein IalB
MAQSGDLARESKDTLVPAYIRRFRNRTAHLRRRVWGIPGGAGLVTSAALFALAQLLLAIPMTDHALAVDAPEGTVKSQHGDWQVVCKDPPPGSKNPVCALVQSVTAEDKNNIGLTVYFQKFSNGTRVLRVFAPLGVLLPPGLGLKIDNKDVGHAPFLRCHSFACYAQVVVDDPLIQRLETGKTAIFIIFQTEEAGIGIPISLKGFADALKELK